MTTSQGLTNVDDPWSYRQGLNVDDDDSWLLLPDTFSHDNDLLVKALQTTITSRSSGSFDSPASSKRKVNCLHTKASTKRRSRASQKSLTTFIAADPSNFRQMVQQVTGAKYIDHDSSFRISVPILKPETLRLVNKLQCCPSDQSTAVTMLDTSGNGASAKSNTAVDASGSDTNSTFPTLESWRIM